MLHRIHEIRHHIHQYNQQYNVQIERNIAQQYTGNENGRYHHTRIRKNNDIPIFFCIIGENVQDCAPSPRGIREKLVKGQIVNQLHDDDDQ